MISAIEITRFISRRRIWTWPSPLGRGLRQPTAAWLDSSLSSPTSSSSAQALVLTLSEVDISIAIIENAVTPMVKLMP